MKKIKAVIFDLDGTLADTLPLCIEAFRKSVEPLAKRRISDAEIIATFGPSEEGTIMSLVSEHYDKGIADYLHFYENLHHKCHQPFPGMEDILMTLKAKNVRLAMVTGKGKYSTGISLKQFNMVDLFEIIETGSPKGPQKSEGILRVLDRWKNVEKTEVIYVGDAPADIIASKNAGVPVVAAAWAPTAEPAKLIPLEPDAIFNTIAEFAKWLHSNTQNNLL